MVPYIPLNQLKDVPVISAPCLTNICTQIINKDAFPDNLKLADMTPVLNRRNRLAIKCFAYYSIMSKLFEKQLQNHTEKNFR